MQELSMYDKKTNETPEIYCSIDFIFKDDVDINNIITEFNELGISIVKVVRPKLTTSIEVTVAAVNYERLWYCEDALSKMFSQVDGSLSELKLIVDKYGGNAVIDISFIEYGTYPALTFPLEIMDKIHALNAMISIDPY